MAGMSSTEDVLATPSAGASGAASTQAPGMSSSTMSRSRSNGANDDGDHNVHNIDPCRGGANPQRPTRSVMEHPSKRKRTIDGSGRMCSIKISI
ncbi:hypothetical protein CIRG_01735 [Coccidioides immitis RMSCC 2394]|uniref:Uncharacterized protein n=1 Tax=Coccidioides immitis RMSCC 2394 TaxID=404692 RepID=A0A0J6XZ50_COCIT|nr:hypothetical protein CIRG_01735 [Coccidioides immitis RMSCC 2394]